MHLFPFFVSGVLYGVSDACKGFLSCSLLFELKMLKMKTSNSGERLAKMIADLLYFQFLNKYATIFLYL